MSEHIIYLVDKEIGKIQAVTYHQLTDMMDAPTDERFLREDGEWEGYWLAWTPEQAKRIAQAVVWDKE